MDDQNVVQEEVKEEVSEPVVEEVVEPVKEEEVVEPVLTEQENADLVRYKIQGNLTQNDALAYHELLNKEAGI